MSGLSPECAPKGTSAGAYGFTSSALVGLPLARDGFELNRRAVPYFVGRISGHVPGMRARQPGFAETSPLNFLFVLAAGLLAATISGIVGTGEAIRPAAS
jgi:hypothetical protein